MTTTLPAYLNEAFFKEALERTLQKDIKIKQLQIVRNTIGGSYCSAIYRATIQYHDSDNKDESVKLLIKDVLDSLVDMTREYFMYVTVLPELNAILKQCQPDGGSFSPKLYLTRKQLSEETYVFEDLAVRNYALGNRLVGFNVEEAKAVFAKLGQYHATTMCYKEKQPDIVTNVKDLFYKSDPHLMDFTIGMVNANTKHVTEIIAKWPNFEDIARKMLQNNMGENFKRKLLAILDRKDAKIHVLAHGDVWLNNIFLLKEGETTKDVIFVDYQASFYGTPAIDINNLLMTSMQLDVLKTQRLPLIEHYYKHFYKTIKACGNYPVERIPTLEDFLEEVKRTEYFSYYGLIFPFAQTNLSENLAKTMNFNDLSNEERLAENRKDIFSSKRVLDTFAHELQRLNALGVLD